MLICCLYCNFSNLGGSVSLPICIEASDAVRVYNLTVVLEYRTEMCEPRGGRSCLKVIEDAFTVYMYIQ
jgi:hypothetical protein